MTRAERKARLCLPVRVKERRDGQAESWRLTRERVCRPRRQHRQRHSGESFSLNMWTQLWGSPGIWVLIYRRWDTWRTELRRTWRSHLNFTKSSFRHKTDVRGKEKRLGGNLRDDGSQDKSSKEKDSKTCNWTKNHEENRIEVIWWLTERERKREASWPCPSWGDGPDLLAGPP